MLNEATFREILIISPGQRSLNPLLIATTSYLTSKCYK